MGLRKGKYWVWRELDMLCKELWVGKDCSRRTLHPIVQFTPCGHLEDAGPWVERKLWSGPLIFYSGFQRCREGLKGQQALESD